MPKKQTVKPKKDKTTESASLKTDVYNIRGEKVAKTSLPGEIFAVKVSPKLLAQTVRIYQANQRLGTHDSKTRSEVIGSTRKIYRQKGTGRARHGAITAPTFIGGGVAHGPKPRDYSLTLPQKMKKVALFGMLTDKLQTGTLKIVRGLEKIETKTARMAEVLDNLKLTADKKKRVNTLLVTSNDFENITLAGRNIEFLQIENAKLLNAYEVLLNRNIIFMEDAVPVLANHFLAKTPQKEIPQKTVKSQLKPAPVKTKSAKRPVKSKKTVKTKK